MSTNAPDAGVVNIKGTDKALAMSGLYSRFVHVDPEVGCAMAVSEAARNIAPGVFLQQ